MTLPKTSSKGWKSKSKSKNGQKEDNTDDAIGDQAINNATGVQGPTVLDAMPEDVLNSVVDETDQSPLSLISDRYVVEEMLSSNPQVNAWKSTLKSIQEYIDEDEPAIKSMLESETVDEMTNQELELLSQLENAIGPLPIYEFTIIRYFYLQICCSL